MNSGGRFWRRKACPEQASSEVETRVEGGGEIVATGTPEQVVKEPRSYTGRYLAPLLGKKAVSVAAE